VFQDLIVNIHERSSSHEPHEDHEGKQAVEIGNKESDGIDQPEQKVQGLQDCQYLNSWNANERERASGDKDTDLVAESKHCVEIFVKIGSLL